MIPTIGVMIGAYIVLRCFELFLAAEDVFVSSSAKLCVAVLALVVMLVAVAGIADLVIAGGAFPALRPSHAPVADMPATSPPTVSSPYRVAEPKTGPYQPSKEWREVEEIMRRQEREWQKGGR